MIMMLVRAGPSAFTVRRVGGDFAGRRPGIRPARNNRGFPDGNWGKKRTRSMRPPQKWQTASEPAARDVPRKAGIDGAAEAAGGRDQRGAGTGGARSSAVVRGLPFIFSSSFSALAVRNLTELNSPLNHRASSRWSLDFLLCGWVPWLCQTVQSQSQ